MLKFFCKCGSQEFKVNRRHGMLQCRSCGQRYIWKEKAWQEFNMSVRDVIREFCFNPPKKFIEETAETMGQWMERHGITREKKPLVKIKKEISFPPPGRKGGFTDRHFRKKWAHVIQFLEVGKPFTFSKNSHYGKLRGRDIAKAAHRDLRRIGIETRLKFIKNDGAELVKQ